MFELSKRIVLRYKPGQFSFRSFDSQAADPELHALALQLNSVQEDEVEQIVKVQVLQLY